MAISFITTIRLIDETRLKNLEVISNFFNSFFPEIKFIVVEQDLKKKCNRDILPQNHKYIFVYNPNLFNKSWGLNIGFKNCNSNFFIFGDIDIIINLEDFRKALNLTKKYDVINPYNIIIDYNYHQLLEFIQNNNLNIEYKNTAHRIGINFACGTFIINRNSFKLVGGWDETFEGCGGEDYCFTYKLEKLIPQKRMITLNKQAIHLYHHGSKKTNKEKKALNPNYKDNIEFLEKITNMSMDRLIIYVKKNINNIGNINKYKK